MSRLFGDVAHQAYVVPDFDAALEKLNAAGIGPAFVLRRIRGAGRYRGDRHDSLISAAFAYSGDTCLEILTPHDDVPSAYREYLERRPEGGLHALGRLAAVQRPSRQAESVSASAREALYSALTSSPGG